VGASLAAGSWSASTTPRCRDRAAGSRSWLLIQRGDAEICEKHPGGEEDLVVVVSDPVAFARWDLGELDWGDALRCGAIQVRGSHALARALPTWKRRAEPVRRPPAARPATTST
jgi:hypothetical protein